MGILSFFIVLAFNLYWLSNGIENFKEIYTGKFGKGITIAVWLYAAWGLFNLIYFFYK